MAGDHSASTRAWAKYGDFANTLCRWLSGEDVPAGLGVVPRLRGTELSVDLFYGEDWTQRLAKDGPKLVLGGAQLGSTRVIPWQRLAPGHFQSKISLHPGERARGAVQVGESVLPFGPVSAGSNAEWQFRREALSELQALSTLTGGRERLDLASAWETPPQQHPRDLRPWLVALLLLVLVVEALLTRLGTHSSP
jgi:hypothetical protein